MDQKGKTLVETLFVIGIISTAFLSLGYSYQDWMGKYRVEGTVKELYTDLMHARALAITRNCPHMMILNTSSYSLYADSNEDGSADASELVHPFPKNIDYALSWNNTGSKVSVDKQGLVSQGRTIRINSSASPEFDCIKISSTRIIMGRYESGDCKIK